MTKFSKQPRDVHTEPTLVQRRDFLWTWLGQRPDLREFTRLPPLILNFSAQAVPPCLSSRGFSCLIIALFSYFPPKSLLLFFFTFKPSQALFLLWFSLKACERLKMLFHCGRCWHRRQSCWFKWLLLRQEQNWEPGWGPWSSVRPLFSRVHLSLSW